MIFQTLFGGESSIPINRPMDEMSWPTSCNGKVVHHTMPSSLQNEGAFHYSIFTILVNSVLSN